MRKLSPRKRGTVVAGLVLAGGLVAGGATAFAASDSAPATGTASPDSASTAAYSPGAGAAHKRHHHRLRFFARGVHGQVTVKNAKSGQFVVREWQRGRITGVSGDNVTVRSADGTSWTWAVEQNAKITRDGKKIAESALKDGDAVLVVGKQNGSAHDGGRIFAPSAAQKARAAQRHASA